MLERWRKRGAGGGVLERREWGKKKKEEDSEKGRIGRKGFCFCTELQPCEAVKLL